MKKTLKRVLCAVLAAAMVASLAGCAKINYVTNGTISAIKEVKNGDWQNTGEEGDDLANTADVSVLDASFAAGTYGGVEFTSLDDVANYYVEAYNYTKSLTAQYIDADGNTQTFYKLLGDEKLEVGQIMIGGAENSMINNMVPGIVSGIFAPNIYGLVPCYNRNPEMDNNFDDATKKNDHDFRTSGLTGEDILDASITDNGDGTITMAIQPKQGNMSFRGEDSQGKFFEVLGDIGGAVSSISVISFASGTPEENVIVDYRGGVGTIKIDTATKEIVEADYVMVANVGVNHASIAVIKDKSASLVITYTNHFPASDEYLMDTKGLKKA